MIEHCWLGIVSSKKDKNVLVSSAKNADVSKAKQTHFKDKRFAEKRERAIKQTRILFRGKWLFTLTRSIVWSVCAKKGLNFFSEKKLENKNWQRSQLKDKRFFNPANDTNKHDDLVKDHCHRKPLILICKKM